MLMKFHPSVGEIFFHCLLNYYPKGMKFHISPELGDALFYKELGM